MEAVSDATGNYDPLPKTKKTWPRRAISGLTAEILMSPLDGDRLFPASADNDPGKLSKLALPAHYCPLRPLLAMHRVKR